MTDEPMLCGDPSCTKLHPPKAAAEFAVNALVLAQRTQRRAALRVLAHISERWGATGMIWAARMWCTLTIEHTALRDADVENLDGLAFGTVGDDGVLDVATAQLEVDDVEPGWRWAARFLLASKLDDTDLLEGLVASVQDDPSALTDAVTHLLLACGAALANPDRVLVEAGEPS